MSQSHLQYRHCNLYQPGDPLPAHLIRLMATEPLIHITEVLRSVAKRRLVLKGHWKNQPVVVKLFFSRWRHRHHCRQELKGLMTLQQQQINCPSILYQGILADEKRCSIIVTEFIDAPTFNQHWQQAETPHQQNAALSLLFTTFQKCIHANIQYTDCHFDNFLVKDNALHLLDGAAVKLSTTTFSEKQRLGQYAQLLSQFDLPPSSEQYKRCINAIPDCGSTSHQLAQAVIALQQHRLQANLKKSLRSCTAYQQKRSWHQNAVINRLFANDAMLQWLQTPNVPFATAQILKQGNSTTVIQTTLGKQAVVIKRYNLKSKWHFLRRMLRRSRAQENWLNGQTCHHFGIPSLKPIAFLERRWGWLQRESYLVYLYQEGERADKVLTDPDLPPQRQRVLVKKINTLLQQLHDARISHGDLKASNFLISDNNEIILLDLDALTLHRTDNTFQPAHHCDLARFNENWRDHSTLQNQFQHAINKTG